MYRRFQTSTSPVNIYHDSCLILLLNAFTTEQLSKVLNWGRYLLFNNRTPDYMYYILQQASFIPSYRPRQRAIASIFRWLTNMGMPTCANFTMKTCPDIKKKAIKEWTRTCINNLGPEHIHLQRCSSRLEPNSLRCPVKVGTFILSISRSTWKTMFGT